MEQEIKGMVYRLLFPSVIGIPVKLQGQAGTASDRILTQEYTAVICMAVRSFTRFPEVEFPRKKL